MPQQSKSRDSRPPEKTTDQKKSQDEVQVYEEDGEYTPGHPVQSWSVQEPSTQFSINDIALDEITIEAYTTLIVEPANPPVKGSSHIKVDIGAGENTLPLRV